MRLILVLSLTLTSCGQTNLDRNISDETAESIIKDIEARGISIPIADKYPLYESISDHVYEARLK